MCFLDIFINISILKKAEDNKKKWLGYGFAFLSAGNVLGGYLISRYGFSLFTYESVAMGILSVILIFIPPLKEESGDK